MSIELSYQLAELSSAQHRAGLAGLVLMVQELPNQPWFEERENVIIEFSKINEYGATLKLNLEGIKALFDLTYKAFQEDRWSKQKDKEKEYKEGETKTREIKDKKGNPKLITEYRYTVVVPQGAFLLYWDKSAEDEKKRLWIKLWRDMVWNIVRDKDKSRTPFKERVSDNHSYFQDAEKVWQALQNPEKAIGQSGSYYLGAMASTSDNIPTRDIIRYQFLLNFAPFVFQVYCPATLNKDGNREFSSYAIVVPDVANLIDFCDDFQYVLEQRKNKLFGYLPLEAIIDLPEEGALDVLRLLRKCIGHKTGSQTLEDLILGAEVIHAEKAGNSVKFHSISYVEPIVNQVKRYEDIQNLYWCPWFRKQRLLNLLNPQPNPDDPNAEPIEIPAWIGFDALLSRVPRKWLEDPYFSHDTRELFNIEVLKNQGDPKMSSKIRQYAEVVYQVCKSYVLRKLEVKYDLTWDKCKGNYKKEADYNEKKTKIANEAFLAVRSRTESQAFIDYFVSTLYPFIKYPFVKKEEFAQFAEDLFNKTDEIRSLTLLALASQFSSSKKSEEQQSESQAA